jgi:hypothetical protein
MNTKELWFFLFFLGCLLFNWPVLSIFDLSLPLYLFVLWAVFILVIRLLIRGADNQSTDNV